MKTERYPNSKLDQLRVNMWILIMFIPNVLNKQSELISTNLLFNVKASLNRCE